MYGERSSERVNVRVVLHMRQTLLNHRRHTTGSGCLRMSCNWHGSHFVKPFLPWAVDARRRKDNERSVVWKRLVLSPLSVALVNYSSN